jgi:endothelin-converting enzyme/putative endopeptidase
MFELLGDDRAAAQKKAATVMAIETALAKGHLDVTSRRDPDKIYHRMPVKELAALAPAIDWTKYLAGIGAPVTTLNVAVPEFFQQMNEQINAVALADWKVYLTWHALRAAAPLLPSAFVNENFDFYSRTLFGAKELRPRWKRCVDYTDADLGEALGQKYVELTFGQQGKERTLAMVRALEKALERDIQQLDWMTPTTKKRALEKLHAMSNKIGFPEKWRQYTFDVTKGDLLGNSQRANVFEFKRQMAKIGKPVDKSEWLMTPPTVNAYYDPQNNNINFPAGILQPPFFDIKMDDAVNFGGIGGVIGHELTHGFDDEGGRFDAKGNLDNWWTETDAKEFEKRTACIAKQYSEYVAVDELKVNGKLTLGENVADNGGLRIAYMALMDTLAGKERDKIDGFTPEQRLFLGWGQIWCTNMRDEAARVRTLTDPHSPPKYRVNGAVSNMPEFQKAFGCRPGQTMVRENACRVW